VLQWEKFENNLTLVQENNLTPTLSLKERGY
jgi:hypothetical protein